MKDTTFENTNKNKDTMNEKEITIDGTTYITNRSVEYIKSNVEEIRHNHLLNPFPFRSKDELKKLNDDIEYVKKIDELLISNFLFKIKESYFTTQIKNYHITQEDLLKYMKENDLEEFIYWEENEIFNTIINSEYGYNDYSSTGYIHFSEEGLKILHILTPPKWRFNIVDGVIVPRKGGIRNQLGDYFECAVDYKTMMSDPRYIPKDLKVFERNNYGDIHDGESVHARTFDDDGNVVSNIWWW